MKQSGNDFDVVIAGGGMVGASLACALALLKLRIAVVEAVPVDDAAQPSFDLRTTALSGSSQRILESIGVWPAVASRATAIRRIHVSEQGRFGTALIDAAGQGVPALGYVVENRQLGPALWSRLQSAGDVQLLCPARIDDVSTSAQGIEASVQQEGRSQLLTGRLLVVADGASSPLRDALGVSAQRRAYHQSAIVGTVEVSAPGQGDMAFERFMSAGPLALLPAGGPHYVFVLTRREAEVNDCLALSDDAFRQLLQDSFGYRLGRFGRLGSRHAYPLALTRASQVTARRAAIIGNAAHALHPVAGQGYNLGLRDAATLAEIIADDRQAGGADAGAAALLERYQDWRHRDHRNVVAFTDGLIHLFDLDGDLTGVARGLALSAFDVAPGAKRALARQTMGLGGRLTRLARGLGL